MITFVSSRERAAPPLRGRPEVLRALCVAVGVVVTFLAGCGEHADWSPLDGPWDPNHPEAARILAPPAPDEPIDREMAEAGERWYRLRGCLACHALEGDQAAGPAMLGITLRREYDWFRGMVMRPDSMLRVDPVAQDLLRVYRVPMPNQGVDELRTRAMWEYLRMLDRQRFGEEGTPGRSPASGDPPPDAPPAGDRPPPDQPSGPPSS